MDAIQTPHAGTTMTGELALGSLSLHHRERLAIIDRRPLSLTRTEFELLWTLALESERVVTRAELQDHVFGDALIQQMRTIDVHICHLRKKLHEADLSIETVRMVGYRLVHPKNKGVDN